MKNLKKYHKMYLVFGILMCALTVAFLMNAVLHPRPHNIFVTLVSGIWTALVFRWMKHPAAPGIVPVVLAVCISLVAAHGIMAIPDLVFPYHAPYEYKADIARRRLSTFYDYSFFPDELPKEAKNVTWVMLPSFLQGSGTEVLFFDIDAGYIDRTIAQYGGSAQIVGVEDDMMFDNYYDKSRLDKLTVYKLYDNDDMNHLHMWGFFVDEEIGRIGYFCQ